MLKEQKDGTLKQTIIPFFPTGNKNIHQDSMKIPCKAAPMCIQTFKNKQGLGSHLNSCPYYQEKLFKEKTSACPVILIDKKVDASKDIRIATQKSTIANEIDQQKNTAVQNHISSVIPETTVTDRGIDQPRLNKDSSSDQRKHNCQSAKRAVFTVQQNGI